MDLFALRGVGPSSEELYILEDGAGRPGSANDKPCSTPPPSAGAVEDKVFLPPLALRPGAAARLNPPPDVAILLQSHTSTPAFQISSRSPSRWAHRRSTPRTFAFGGA